MISPACLRGLLPGLSRKDNSQASTTRNYRLWLNFLGAMQQSSSPKVQNMTLFFVITGDLTVPIERKVVGKSRDKEKIPLVAGLF
jgi:hypothetical protein